MPDSGARGPAGPRLFEEFLHNQVFFQSERFCASGKKRAHVVIFEFLAGIILGIRYPGAQALRRIRPGRGDHRDKRAENDKSGRDRTEPPEFLHAL